MKAQAATEYIILLGLILVTLIPIVAYTSYKTTSTIRINQAEDTVQLIAKTADNLYTLGPGNQEYISFNIPSGTNWLKIQNNRDVVLNLTIFGSFSTVHSRSIANMVNTTTLPNQQGTYHLTLKVAENGDVLIFQP